MTIEEIAEMLDTARTYIGKQERGEIIGFTHRWHWFPDVVEDMAVVLASEERLRERAEERDNLVKNYIEVCEHWIGLLKLYGDEKSKEISRAYETRYQDALEALFPHIKQLRALADATKEAPE